MDKGLFAMTFLWFTVLLVSFVVCGAICIVGIQCMVDLWFEGDVSVDNLDSFLDDRYI